MAVVAAPPNWCAPNAVAGRAGPLPDDWAAPSPAPGKPLGGSAWLMQPLAAEPPGMN